MNIKNLTPHAIVIRPILGDDVTIHASGTVARVSSTPGKIAQRDDLFVGCRVAGPTTYGEVEGLPEPADGVVYLVSAMVLVRLSGRTDVFAPDTGAGAIRNDKGQIVAVTGLVGCSPG